MFFSIQSREHFLRRKRFWRQCTGLVICLVMGAVIARNVIARVAIEQIGSVVLGNSVSVQRVWIGRQRVEIIGLEVTETSLADVPQLEVHGICLAPSLWRGLRQGIWLRHAVVREPTVHVRFDRHGNLLSQFPKSEAAPTTEAMQLPFDLATVLDGTVVIHQEGRPALEIRGASLQATVDQSIHIRAEITDLLGSQLQFESRVEQSTLAGRTRVKLAPMTLETRNLATLPLVPADLAAHPLSCILEADLGIEHPANEFDLRKHVVGLHARVSDVNSVQFGNLTSGIDLRATLRDGRSSLLIQGPFARGELSLNAQADLLDRVPQVAATFRMVGVELEPIVKVVAPEFSLSATASAEGTAQAWWENRTLTFDGSLLSGLSDIQVDGIPAHEVNATIAWDGSFASDRKLPLIGSISVQSSSDGIELADVARRFGRSHAKGSIGFDASGMIPLETLVDIETYQGLVSVHASSIVCEGIAVGPSSLNATLQAGKLDVSLADANLVVASVAERSEACMVNRLQVAETLQIRARLESSAPVAKLTEPESWFAAATVDVRGLAIANEPLSDFTASCQLAKGAFKLEPCGIRWRDSVCRFEGRGDLGSDARVEIGMDAGPIRLEDLSDLASRFSTQPLPLAGTATTRGGIRLDLQPFGISAAGDLALSEARYANTRIGNAKLTWEASPQVVTIRSQSNDFCGGSYVVDASLQSLDWTQTEIAASAQNIQLKRLAGMVGQPLSMSVSGLLDGSLVFRSIGEWDTLRADGWVRTREASVAGTPIELQTSKLALERGVANVVVRGTAFDGTLDGEASVEVEDFSRWVQQETRQIHQVPVFGRVQVKSVSLKRALAVLDRQHALANLSGNLEMSCLRDTAISERGLLATADCSAENVRWEQSVMSKRLRATIACYPSRIEVNNLDGQFADGKISGDAKLNLARVPSGEFRFDVQRVNLRRALAPMPELARSASGAVSLSVSGRMGSTSAATAKLHASNIVVSGLTIRELRMPVTCSFQSQSSQVHWQSRGGTVNVGGGIVGINSEGNLIHGLVTMMTSVEIRHVDTAKLMRGKSISAGIIDGNVNLQSKRARTAKDLTGRFQLELSQIKSLEVPGSETFTQLVKLPTFSGPSFDQKDGGTIDGRLAGGLLHVDKLELTKGGILVLMDGTSTLEGRLDFDVTAITNQAGPADGLFAFADSPLMLGAPAPVTLLIKANEALKDRVVHVHVGGTAVRPTLRLQPGKTLSQDALRFFIAGTLGNRAADIALRQQR